MHHTTGKIIGKEFDLLIIDELIDAGEKKPRTRKAAPNRSSDANIRQFVKNLAERYPTFMGGDMEKFDQSAIAGATLLARVISAINYTPSSIELLADHAGLTKKGIITDADLTSMTLRMMTDHCSRPMMVDLENKVRAHEKKLIEELAKPAAEKKEHTTVVVQDELLGRVEVNAETGEMVRIVDDHESAGEVLVDDTTHIDVEANAASAEQSQEWGSW